jgi:23S rRNA (guanosine2251-2'-O)-methyltransferase
MAAARSSRSKARIKPDRGRHAGAATPLVFYGRHAVLAALANPARPVRRAVSLDAPAPEFTAAAAARGLTVETLERGAFAALVGAEAAHQGMGAVVDPLPEPAAEALLACDRGLVLVLDQVSDPRNVGAVLRSAAAFGATALVVQTRHAAPLNAACAKAAAGALEWVPVLHEVNLARFLTRLAGRGWWTAGLDGGAARTFADFTPAPKQVVVLGAEGRGLRPLVRERCDVTVRIPIRPPVESLNVAVAAGIALHHCATRPAD